MRTTAEENAQMGRWIGERVNRMEGPVRFFLPEAGSRARRAGQGFRRHECAQCAVPGAGGDHPPRAEPASRSAAAQHQRSGFRRSVCRAFRDLTAGACAARSETMRWGHMDREAFMERFPAHDARNEPIVGGGAGTGLSAKSKEAGGIDLIVIYNSGRYRMAGRGSLAGLMTMATPTPSSWKWPPRCCRWSSTRRCWPASAPPTRSASLDRFLDQVAAAGFAGVTELPDRRPHRRHVPRQSRRDGHEIRWRWR